MLAAAVASQVYSCILCMYLLSEVMGLLPLVTKYTQQSTLAKGMLAAAVAAAAVAYLLLNIQRTTHTHAHTLSLYIYIYIYVYRVHGLGFRV